MHTRFPLLMVLMLGLFQGPGIHLAAQPVSVRVTAPDAEKLAAEKLEEFVNSSRFSAAQWGCNLVALPEGRVVWAHQASRLFKPASTAKLFTCALALHRFGPEKRIRTSIYSSSQPDADGVLHGDLMIHGRGDPSFSARFFGNDSARALEPLLSAIRLAGIREIQGDLIGDDTEFSSDPFGSNWAWDDLQAYYGAEVSALSYQDNAIDLVFRPGLKPGDPVKALFSPSSHYLEFDNWTQTTATNGIQEVILTRLPGARLFRARGGLPAGGKDLADSITVPEPALWFVTVLADRLKAGGLRMTGRPRALHAEDLLNPDRKLASDWKELTFVEGAPLKDVVRQTLKSSQNLYAQLLLLQAGARRERAQFRAEENPAPGKPWLDRKPVGFQNTEALGIQDLKEWMRECKLASREVLMDEGSGLSRSALVTPQVVTSLLVFLHRSEYRQLIQDSLPIAGVDGTLKNRLVSGPAKGVLKAKTGTLAYVNALAGYLPTEEGRTYAFSFMLNQFNPVSGGKSGRAEVDAAAELMVSILLPKPLQATVGADKP